MFGGLVLPQMKLTYNSFVICFNMHLQLSLLTCLELTLIAGINHSFVLHFNMHLQIAPLSCLVLTLITRMPQVFVNTSDMRF